MLLRLVGVVVLSALCSASDDTQFYSEKRLQFEDQRVKRSLNYGNFSEAIPGGPVDMSVMFPDTSICDVLLSSPEPISMDKIPFFCFCSHCKATTGPKGERGDRGLPGFPGSPGKRGYMGYRGRRGHTGPPGLKGQKGDQGDKGQPGPIGFLGPKGEQGTKGEKGDHGDDGPPGPLGPQGWPGDCLCDATIGHPGIQGPPGPQGAQGLPGSAGSKGTKGAKGDKGDLGENGSDGADGLKGEQGDSGECDCTDGEKGTDGEVGDKGDTGGKGDIGPKGDQGDAGDPGLIGDPGFPGIPGPCSMPIQSSFCVGLDESFPTMNKPVRFSRNIFNRYDHYNTILGVYIAPANGTYVFDFNFAVNTKVLIVGLFVNFFPIIKMTETTNYATTSSRVVLHLSARDLVWIQIKDNDSNGMFVDSELSSTFCGFLLFPDSCSFEGSRDYNHHLPDEIINERF